MSLGEGNHSKSKTPDSEVDYASLTTEELLKTITKKQKVWCHEYIIDWNASRAARVAEYSTKTASDIGHENTKKPKLVEYCKRISKDVEKEAGISRLRLANEYAKLAFSSIAHMHDTWIDRKELDALTDDQKSCIQEIETQTKQVIIDDLPTEVEKIKIKLYSKQAALDSLRKMLGYDEPARIDHTTGGDKIPGVIIMPDNGRGGDKEGKD